MRRPQPDAAAIDVRLRTRSGWCTAMTCPIIPPADALLALTDGMSSHLLQGLHAPDEVLAVLRDHLNLLFAT